MTSYRPIKPRRISGANFGEHLNELRDDEMTRLPQDRATLMKVLDRLEKRKLWRAQREFYAFVSEEKAADEVLKLLDTEIGDEGKGQLA
jgi:hypothetical protein